MVTAALTDIVAEENKETITDTATAAADDVRPMVMTFLDALNPNSNGILVANEKVPQNIPIIMTFSEPITRVTAGGSTTGVVLGRVDPTSTDLALLDTIPVEKKWGPSCKELRLYPNDSLEIDSTYRVLIPSGVKDLALNKLDGIYSGLFTVKKAEQEVPFALKKTVPPDGDTIPLGFPVELVFSRPIDALSLSKNADVVSADNETIRGYFEGKSGAAKFVNTGSFVQGQRYTMSVSSGVKDLLGDSIGTETSFSFWIAPKDSFEQKVGLEGEAAAFINRFMGAYLAGDIETFASAFHPNFEEIYVDDIGKEFRHQRAEFLEYAREDVAFIDRYSKAGILAPVNYQVPWTDGEPTNCWKLDNGRSAVLIEDLRDREYMSTIHVFDLDGNDITDSVVFTNRSVIYNGDTLVFDPDFTKSYADPELLHDDPQLYGKLLQEETDVELGLMTMDFNKSFEIRNMSVSNDTAKVMIENSIEGIVTSDFKMDPEMPDTIYEILVLQSKLIKQDGNWSVLQMVSKMISSFGGSDDEDHSGGPSVDDSMFVYQDFQQTQAIDFIAPAHKAVSVDSPLILRWDGPDDPNLGGYLVAISNELSGGNAGLLVYTKNDSLMIGANGAVTGGKVLTVRPTSLPVPLPPFEQRLSSFAPADQAVYLWKVVGINDTVASTISTATEIIADSDFGSHGFGPGVFTFMDQMPDLMMDFGEGPGSGEDMFGDRDGDLYPDWIEQGYGTNPDDPAEYPNFALDTDGDRYPDFMEALAGSDPQSKTSTPEDVEGDMIADVLQQSPEWRPELAMDDDGDGFPNEIEFLAATDPWNHESKPTKSIKQAAPVGTWYGVLEPDGGERVALNVTITSSDSAGDRIWIDSTDLPNVPRNGINFDRPLRFNYGEWVFTIPIVSGIQTGKYLKFRFTKGQHLEGWVDIVDDSTMGGPYVGRFMAAETRDYNFDEFTGGGGSNDSNFGPPPSDAYHRPDSARDLSLAIQQSSNGYTVKVAMDSGDTLTDNGAFWSPGMWPSLGFNTNVNGIKYHLNGDLFRSGDPATGDTLFLIGFFSTDSSFEHEEYDFVLKLTGYGDVWQPTGTWSGWYTERQYYGGEHEGPLPFVGPETVLQEALTTTDSMAILDTESGQVYQKIVGIQPRESQEPWIVITEDSSEYYVLEAHENWEQVMLGPDADGNGAYLVLVDIMDSMPMDAMPFTGDSTTVYDALNQVDYRGMVDGTQTTLTLSNPFRDDMKGEWLVDGSDGVTYVILEDPGYTGAVFLLSHNGTEAVMVMPVDGSDTWNPDPSWVLYDGDSQTLGNSLGSVGNTAIVYGTQEVIQVSMPHYDDYYGWVAMRNDHYYLIAGDPMDLTQVAMQNQAVLVYSVSSDPGSDTTTTSAEPVPYQGDSQTLDFNLTNVGNNGVVTGTDTPFYVTNPRFDSLTAIWYVEDNMGKSFIVAGDPGDPTQLSILQLSTTNAVELIDPGFVSDPGTGDSTSTSDPLAFQGDWTVLDSALTRTAFNGITHGSDMNFTIHNPRIDSGSGAWIVDDYSGKIYVVLADPIDPMQVSIIALSDSVMEAVELMEVGSQKTGPDIAGPWVGDTSEVTSVLNVGAPMTAVWVDSTGHMMFDSLGNLPSSTVSEYVNSLGESNVMITYNSVNYLVMANSQGEIALGKDNDILIMERDAALSQ